jgi:type I restriction enzyme S subunit
MMIGVPPLDEQGRIVAFLDAKMRGFAAMDKTVDAVITRLTEYRAALITDATTGKIDVRHMKSPQPHNLDMPFDAQG